MADVNKSKSRSQSRSASSIPVHSLPFLSGNLRSSRIKTKGKLAASFNGSPDFSTIENEYIRNLQQQIYFLELECEYLRNQNQRIATVPSQISLEAERMIKKLKAMQLELEQRERNLIEQESKINILQHAKDNTQSKLNIAEESFSKEKRELVHEVVSLKKQLERFELDAAKSKVTIHKVKSELEDNVLQSRESENKINILRAELNEKTEDYNKLCVAYEKQKADGLKTQTEYKELEERFFHSKALSKEEVDKGLKEELKHLRYELREKELQAEQDRTLRLKISDDCAALVKENAALSSQVIEFQKQIDMERHFNHDSSLRKQANIQELVTLKEERKHIDREVERLKEILHAEQQKYRNLLDKYTQDEHYFTREKYQKNRLKAELEELEGIKSAESHENIQLRRDKQLLTDEVIGLQDKLHNQSKELEVVNLRWEDMKLCNSELESKLRYQTNFDQIRWEEFERMADEMKNFSRSMSPIRQSITHSVNKNKSLELT